LTDKQHRFGWVNASYVYGLQIIDDTHMIRALGAITDWETYKKATTGEFGIDHAKLSEAADKTVRAAVRRASIIQAGALTPHVHTAAAQLKGMNENGDGTSAVLDGHSGPHPESEHASG
jgi:hypothetical protein